MKSSFCALLLLSFLSVGCQSDTSDKTAAATTNVAVTVPQGETPQTPPASYVGMSSSELDAMGVHSCGGHLLSGSAYDANALYTSTYAQTEAACEGGENRIVLERNIAHNATGKANMLILAELHVIEKKPGQQHFVTNLSLNGSQAQPYAVEYVEDGREMVTQVGKLWLVNTATNAFEEVAVPPGFSFPHPYNDLVD